jgi:hypothetical protein
VRAFLFLAIRPCLPLSQHALYPPVYHGCKLKLMGTRK